MHRDKKPVTPSQQVQVGGGGALYEQGTTPYQEGGWWPLWALAGQGTSSLGKEMACKAPKRFRQPFCHQESEEPTRKKTRRPHKSQEGGLGLDAAGWELLKGLGKASYQAARVGAGKAIKSDLAQKKAMEFISPLVGDTLDKLGNKVGG